MIDQGDEPKTKLTHLRYVYHDGDTASPLGFYWPSSDQKRSEIMAVARSSPFTFESIYQCRPGGREGTIFLSSDIDVFYRAPPDLVLGSRLSSNVKAFTSNSAGVFQAWDTAFSSSQQSAYTVCITGMFIPCSEYHCGETVELYGPCDTHYDVCILDVFREKMDWGGLTTAFRQQYLKWEPDGVIIENRASGISLIQALAHSSFPIIPVKSNDSKSARATNSVGARSAGSVQGWFRQHRVRLPDNSPAWYMPWRTEMKDFSGNDDSSTDQVDATVHLVTHAITKGAASAILPSEWAPDRTTGPAFDASTAITDPDAPDQRRAVLDYIGMIPLLTTDPFAGTCSHCVSYKRGYCSHHGRPVIALDCCEAFNDTTENAEFSLAQASRDYSQFRV